MADKQRCKDCFWIPESLNVKSSLAECVADNVNNPLTIIFIIINKIKKGHVTKEDCDILEENVKRISIFVKTLNESEKDLENN